MNRKRTTIVGGVIVVALVGGGVGIAAASSGGDDNDTPVTGPAFDRASEAALAETGGGTVTETEVGDEEGYYEVEVTLPDGSQVDVHLDQDFAVLGTVADSDSGDDSDAGETPGGEG